MFPNVCNNLLYMFFWRTSGPFFTIFSSVAPHRDQPVAKCHPRWQPTRRWAISCGLGRRRIRTRDCRTTVWRTTIEPPRLPRATTPLGGVCNNYSCWIAVVTSKSLAIGQTPVGTSNTLWRRHVSFLIMILKYCFPRVFCLLTSMFSFIG